MNKKGFTLIELLAVIIVLAVIATITVPVVFDLIGNTKKGAFKEAVKGIVRATDLLDANTGFNTPRYFTVTAGTTTYVEDGETKTLKTKGDMPMNGYLKTDDSGNIEYRLQNESYCASKNMDDKEMKVESGECDRLVPANPTE